MAFRSSALLGLAGTSLVALLAALQPACGFDGTGSAPSTDGGAPGQASAAEAGSSSSPGLDKPAECPADHATCGDQCVDLPSDPANCSQCAKSCAFNQGCKQGACFLICPPGMTACGDTCVDLAVDPANCGKCGEPCTTPLLCSAGACKLSCTNDLTVCPGATGSVCADLTSDSKNCGLCGTTCAATERCSASKCTSFCAMSTVVGDVFAPKMVGCVGKVTFANRATLCAPGVTPCGVVDYRARRGANAPHYNYWTNDVLYGKGNTSTCAVSLTTANGYSSCSSTTPMRVCAAHTDAVGNQCNGIGCGYEAYSPNEYFGGCSGDNTAGTLCCPP